MLPETLTTKERIVYSLLPYGYGSVSSIRNALDPSNQRLALRHIASLELKGILTQRKYSLRDSKSRKHEYTFYVLTQDGIKTYFPALAEKVPAIKQWIALHPDLQVPLSVQSLNRDTKDRMLRTIEAEQFCSNVGVRTVMDDRNILLDAVFGCSTKSALDKVTTGIDLCEAVMKANETAQPEKGKLRSCEADDRIGEAAQPILNGCETDEFSFYHSREIHNSIKGTEDLSVLASTHIGLLANSKRAIMVYQTTRFGGTFWNRRSEDKARFQALQFCQHIKNGFFPLYKSIPEAIVFYQTPRELVNTLLGIGLRVQLKYDSLFMPYSTIYAIPYSAEGKAILQNILQDDKFYLHEIDRCLDYGGIMAEELGDEQSLYAIKYYGIKTMCATPLDLGKLASFIMLTKDERKKGQILTYPVYEPVLSKLFGSVQMLTISQKE